jgi:hypothetical protein
MHTACSIHALSNNSGRQGTRIMHTEDVPMIFHMTIGYMIYGSISDIGIWKLIATTTNSADCPLAKTYP